MSQDDNAPRSRTDDLLKKLKDLEDTSKVIRDANNPDRLLAKDILDKLDARHGIKSLTDSKFPTVTAKAYRKLSPADQKLVSKFYAIQIDLPADRLIDNNIFKFINAVSLIQHGHEIAFSKEPRRAGLLVEVEPKPVKQAFFIFHDLSYAIDLLLYRFVPTLGRSNAMAFCFELCDWLYEGADHAGIYEYMEPPEGDFVPVQPALGTEFDAWIRRGKALGNKLEMLERAYIYDTQIANQPSLGKDPPKKVSEHNNGNGQSTPKQILYKGISEDPRPDGDLTPMLSKQEVQIALGLASYRDLRTFLATTDYWEYSRQRIRVRLDTLNAPDRRLLKTYVEQHPKND